MNAPSGRTAPRRTRTGVALITASAVIAAATLVLGAAGGTQALWNDSIPADLGTVAVEPNPPEFIGCSPYGADNWWVKFQLTHETSRLDFFRGYLNNLQLPSSAHPDEGLNPSDNTLGVGNWSVEAAGIQVPHDGTAVSATVSVRTNDATPRVMDTDTVWFAKRGGNVHVFCQDPTPPAPPLGCSGSGHSLILTADHPAGNYTIRWYLEEFMLGESINWNQRVVNGSDADPARADITVEVGKATPAVVTAKLVGQPEQILGRRTVWFFLVPPDTATHISCTEPELTPTAADSAAPVAPGPAPAPVVPLPDPVDPATPIETAPPVVTPDGEHAPREVTFPFEPATGSDDESYDWTLDGDFDGDGIADEHTFTRDGVSADSPVVRVNDAKLREAGVVASDSPDSVRKFEVRIHPEGDAETVVATGAFFARFDEDAQQWLVFADAESAVPTPVDTALEPAPEPAPDPEPTPIDPTTPVGPITKTTVSTEPALRPEDI